MGTGSVSPCVMDFHIRLSGERYQVNWKGDVTDMTTLLCIIISFLLGYRVRTDVQYVILVVNVE